ncbi:acyl carrier protein 3, mitochondrial isoform X1 [Vitis riparia]|uniref:acyl carrier protein 3, mitochondrial isoform X1 n=2 Tax=Vitis riparia TaxID=96939 RepID=UPI00155AD2A8|nr:acyl carrier protein 3, mitochondrial isoform X1 [Vitis riparia]
MGLRRVVSVCSRTLRESDFLSVFVRVGFNEGGFNSMWRISLQLRSSRQNMEGFGNLQFLRNTLLAYLRVRISLGQLFVGRGHKVIEPQICRICTSALSSCDQIMDQVLGLVKKFDKIDSKKVTATADFQKDLCLDSLDRVELVMAFEQEFSVEIPEEEADKLTCCADVAKYIVSGALKKPVEKP